MVNNERIVTSKKDIIDTLDKFSYDLRWTLLKVVRNKHPKQDDIGFLSSNLYWLSKLTYKSKSNQYKKLKEEVYRKYLFNVGYNSEEYLKEEFAKASKNNVNRYNMTADVLVHMIALPNETFDPFEFDLLFSYLWNQRKPKKPLYYNKTSIYPYNLEGFNYKDLLDYRQEFFNEIKMI